MSPGVFEEEFEGISDSEVGFSEIDGVLEITPPVREWENGAKVKGDGVGLERFFRKKVGVNYLYPASFREKGEGVDLHGCM